MSIQYLKAPCGCLIDCPSKTYLLFGGSEKHLAQHKEFDAGIIHGMYCGIQMIKVPKLVLNMDLIK